MSLESARAEASRYAQLCCASHAVLIPRGIEARTGEAWLLSRSVAMYVPVDSGGAEA